MSILCHEDIYLLSVYYASNKNMEDDAPFKCWQEIQIQSLTSDINLCCSFFQSIDSLKKLIQGMSILEKYGKHLLKPVESRSSMWRHIKYSNNIFRERIDPVKVQLKEICSCLPCYNYFKCWTKTCQMEKEHTKVGFQ